LKWCATNDKQISFYFTKNFTHFSMKNNIFLTLHPILSKFSYLHEGFPKFNVHVESADQLFYCSEPWLSSGTGLWRTFPETRLTMVMSFLICCSRWCCQREAVITGTTYNGNVVFDLLLPLVLPEDSGDHKYYI
jgi:hypothetical protein